jgi:hypothetical protein
MPIPHKRHPASIVLLAPIESMTLPTNGEPTAIAIAPIPRATLNVARLHPMLSLTGLKKTPNVFIITPLNANRIMKHVATMIHP